MKMVFRVNDLHVNNSGLPVLSVSDTDKVLAQIPGLRYWFDPSKGTDVFRVSQLLDRASGKVLTPLFTTAAYQWALSNFASGKPAFLLPDSASVAYIAADNSLTMNKTEFSIVAVLQKSSGSVFEDCIVGSLNENDDVAMRWSFNYGSTPQAINLYAGWAGAMRIGMSATDVGISSFDNTLGLFMLTFSVQSGLKTWYNGRLIKANTDVRPLTDNVIKINGMGLSTTGGVSNRGFSGLLGHLLVFDTDLSNMSNAGYLSAMNTALKNYYGIA